MGKSKRRDFLRHAALGGLLAPVAYYWRDIAEAQAMADRRNMVLIFLPNGKTQSNPFINGSGTSFSFADGFRPYEAFKDDCIAFEEYGFQALINAEYTGDHGGHVAPGAAMFSGDVAFANAGMGQAGMAPSIDQIVAWDRARRGHIANPLRATLNIKMAGSSFRIPTVFTSTPADYQLGASYSRSLDPVTQHTQPRDGFAQMFGDFAAMTGETVEELWAFGRSILDTPNAELQGIRSQLPLEGQRLVDEHLQSLRELELSFEDVPPAGMAPTEPGHLSTEPTNHTTVWSEWVRIIDAAMRLDRSHIFTVQFGGIASRFKIPELGLGFVGQEGDSNSGNDHHSYTHWRQESVPLFMDWYAQRVTELLGALKSDGTKPNMLAESAVMVGMEFGRNHNARDVPVTLFGQAGGYFETGRSVTYGNEMDSAHLHPGTLVGLAHAMGATDVAKVGNMKSQYQQGVPTDLHA